MAPIVAAGNDDNLDNASKLGIGALGRFYDRRSRFKEVLSPASVMLGLVV